MFIDLVVLSLCVRFVDENNRGSVYTLRVLLRRICHTSKEEREPQLLSS